MKYNFQHILECRSRLHNRGKFLINNIQIALIALYRLRFSTLVSCQTANVNTRRTMSWTLYHVDRIGRIAHDSGVIVRVHRLGVGHQRCFNQMPCTAAINPAYPPNSGSISHAPNTSYSAKALMSPFYHVVFYTAAPSRTHVIA